MNKKTFKKAVSFVLAMALLFDGICGVGAGNASAELSAKEILEKAQENAKTFNSVESTTTAAGSVLNTDFMDSAGSGAPDLSTLIASGFPKYDTVSYDLTTDVNKTAGVTKAVSKMTYNDQTEEMTYYLDSTKIYTKDGDKWYFVPNSDYMDSASSSTEYGALSDPQAIIDGITTDVIVASVLSGQETIEVKDTLEPGKKVKCYKLTVTDFDLMDTAGQIAGDYGAGSAYSAYKEAVDAKADITYYIGVEDFVLYKTISDIKIKANAKDLAKAFFSMDIGFDYVVDLVNMHMEEYTDITAPPVELPAEVASATIANGYSTSDSTYAYEVTYSGGKPVLKVAYVLKNKKTYKLPATFKILGKSYKVTQISASSFENAKKATKITLPKNITKVGKSAFKNCKKLKTLVVKNKKLKKTLKTKKGRKKAGIRSKAKIK